MSVNRLKASLSGGSKAIGGWCALSDSLAAEIVATLDVDYVVVDMQHGTTGYSDLVSMLQAIQLGGATPLVRIPHRDYGMAQRALDAGAEGIIFPLVDSELDAARAVEACRYPPLGHRSFGPIRARMHLGSSAEAVNSEILCLVQIETLQAMESLHRIVGSPGVDGVYVGPADLALSYGLSIGSEDSRLEALLSEIQTACDQSGRIAGIHTFSGDAAARALERGYHMATVGSDATWLRSGYAGELASARGQSSERLQGFY